MSPNGKNCLPNGKDCVPNGKDCVPNGKDCLLNGKDCVPNGKDCVPNGKDCLPSSSAVLVTVRTDVSLPSVIPTVRASARPLCWFKGSFSKAVYH